MEAARKPQDSEDELMHLSTKDKWIGSAIVACAVIVLLVAVEYLAPRTMVVGFPEVYTVTSLTPLQQTEKGLFGEVRIQSASDSAWYINDDLRRLRMPDAEKARLQERMKVVCRKIYFERTRFLERQIPASSGHSCHLSRIQYTGSPGRRPGLFYCG